MNKIKALATAAVAAGVLAAPATSQAQTDVGSLCHSLVGSETTELGAASLDRCLAASEPEACALPSTINVFNLVRIRNGLCLDLANVVATRTVSVRGVATVRLLP